MVRAIFFRASAVLVGTHNGIIQHRTLVISVGSDILKDPLPDSRLRPAAEPTVHVLPIAETGWQVTPGNPGAAPIEHRFDKQTIVGGRHADRTGSARQKTLDPVPLIVAKAEAVQGSAPKSDRLRIEKHPVPELATTTRMTICCQMWHLGLAPTHSWPQLKTGPKSTRVGANGTRALAESSPSKRR